MPGGLLLVIVAIVVISAVVGVVAQFLNRLNEASAPPQRRLPPRVDRDRQRDATRQNKNDMDRFLAEIDRLRKKNAETSEPTASRPTPSKPAPKPIPVARSTRGERQKAKPRAVAERVEPKSRRVEMPPLVVPAMPAMPQATGRPEELPVATVVGPTSATGAPATRVTRLPTRERPTPKTNLAMNLTGLLGSGQGVAMAVILQEVLGPPKVRK